MLTCICCGTSFCKTAFGGRMPGYCSEVCRRAEKLRRDRMVDPRKGPRHLTCINCGAGFVSRYQRDFCSRRCYNRAKIKQRPVPVCRTCSRPIERSIGRGTDRFYCSWRCKPRAKRGGYVAVEAPGHPLDRGSGSVFEHRIVLYEAIGGGEHPCHWCGKMLSWKEHYNAAHGLGVDHLDFDRTNNVPSNLVPACRSCNVRRRRKHGRNPNNSVAA